MDQQPPSAKPFVWASRAREARTAKVIPHVRCRIDQGLSISRTERSVIDVRLYLTDEVTKFVTGDIGLTVIHRIQSRFEFAGQPLSLLASQFALTLQRLNACFQVLDDCLGRKHGHGKRAGGRVAACIGRRVGHGGRANREN